MDRNHTSSLLKHKHIGICVCPLVSRLQIIYLYYYINYKPLNQNVNDQQNLIICNTFDVIGQKSHVDSDFCVVKNYYKKLRKCY